MPQKLDDRDLLKITHLMLQEADSFLDETIAPSRAKALRYYMGENPDGMPMPEGRSRMVDTQLRDTIEWIMPDLTRTFAGDDEVVSIEPHGNDDIFEADTAEAWVNYVIMRQNRGFLVTYTWIKDALLSKLGFLKQYWKREVIRQRRDFVGLDDVELDYLKRAEDFEIADSGKIDRYVVIGADGQPTYVSKDDLQAGMQPVLDDAGNPAMQTMYDVTGYKIHEEWRIVEEVLPPEEVKFLADTKSIPWDCRFIAHETRKTISEVRELFPDVDIPDDIQGWSITQTGLYDQETIERFYDTSQTIGLDDESDTTWIDPSSRKVWLYECYVRADRDGDGTAEWVQVFRIGDTILEVEEVDYPKIFSICPIPWPHRAVGLSLADLLFDLQDLQTALNRQILDHVYQSNNPRTEIDMSGAGEDTIDDYLDNRIGGYVRVERAGAIRPLIYSPLEPWTFNLLEHWEQKRESRTGISRMNGGLDPNSLNKTATGITQILNQAARRIEQIARIFAETGFRDRIQGILDLSSEYPDYVRGQILRLEGETLEMDPEKLSGRYDLIVNAGIGTGNKEQQAMHMMNLLNVHQQLAMAGMGPGSGDKQMVTMKNIYNVVRDLITNWGHRNTADYITDPSDKKAERDPPAQPQQSPEQIKMQMEAERDKAKLELDKQKMQVDAQKGQADVAIKNRELDIKERELELKARELGVKEWETGHRAGLDKQRLMHDMTTTDKEDDTEEEAANG